jgi:hypothetical protein
MDGFCSIQENGTQHKNTFAVNNNNNNNNNNTPYLCMYLFEVSVFYHMFFPYYSIPKSGTSGNKFVVWLLRPKLCILEAPASNPGYPD